uniref:CX domain-containing protein n=1 Tax=Caenorhabditis tropicalis TaxID=1561998 RepID=A0A1I7T0C6_9PELO
MNLALVVCTATLLMGVTVARGVSNSTLLESSNNLTKHAGGFPMKHFVVTTEKNQTFFDLHNKTGVVYQLAVEYLFRELAWMEGNEIYLTVNVSKPGAAVFLTKCNDYPISLKPNVVHNEYKLSRSCLDAENGCLNIHLIATEGPVDGTLSVGVKPAYKWFHVQIIMGVTASFLLIMVLLRRCVNYVLRFVYSYNVMDDTLAQQERLA